MTAPPDPAAGAAAGRDHAARLYAEHHETCAAKALGDGDPCPRCGERLFYRHGCTVNRPGLTCLLGCGWDGCDECASLALHAERTARQAALLAPAQTGEMF